MSTAYPPKLSTATRMQIILELLAPKDENGDPLPPLVTQEQAKKLMEFAYPTIPAPPPKAAPAAREWWIRLRSSDSQADVMQPSIVGIGIEPTGKGWIKVREVTDDQPETDCGEPILYSCRKHGKGPGKEPCAKCILELREHKHRWGGHPLQCLDCGDYYLGQDEPAPQKASSSAGGLKCDHKHNRVVSRDNGHYHSCLDCGAIV